MLRMAHSHLRIHGYLHRPRRTGHQHVLLRRHRHGWKTHPKEYARRRILNYQRDWAEWERVLAVNCWSDEHEDGNLGC